MGWGASTAGSEARAEAGRRQGNIDLGMRRINDAFSGFDDSFYNQRVKDYLSYAMPQFSQQYRDTRGQLAYSLAGKGLTRSSTARNQQQALERERVKQQQGIAQSAYGSSQQLRRDVEEQRSNLVSQLQASADPATAYQRALSTAATYSAPSPVAPLGQMFQNFGNSYLTSQIAQQSQMPSWYYNMPRSNASAGLPASYSY